MDTDIHLQRSATPLHTHCAQAFVSFSAPTAAQRARAAIHGRLFAGNTVSVSYITAEEFDQV